MITLLDIAQQKVIDFAEVEYISYEDDKLGLEDFGIADINDDNMVIGMKSKRKIRVDKIYWELIYDHWVEVHKFLYDPSKDGIPKEIELPDV